MINKTVNLPMTDFAEFENQLKRHKRSVTGLNDVEHSKSCTHRDLEVKKWPTASWELKTAKVSHLMAVSTSFPAIHDVHLLNCLVDVDSWVLEGPTVMISMKDFRMVFEVSFVGCAADFCTLLTSTENQTILDRESSFSGEVCLVYRQLSMGSSVWFWSCVWWNFPFHSELFHQFDATIGNTSDRSHPNYVTDVGGRCVVNDSSPILFEDVNMNKVEVDFEREEYICDFRR